MFDLNTPYKHQEILADNSFVFENDNTVCVWQNHTVRFKTKISLDFFQKEADNRYKRYQESFFERAYPLDRIERLLAAAGLSILGVYDEDSRNPPRIDSQRVVFVTKKGEH